MVEKKSLAALAEVSNPELLSFKGSNGRRPKRNIQLHQEKNRDTRDLGTTDWSQCLKPFATPPSSSRVS